MTPRFGLLLLAGLAACEHPSPFRPGDYAPSGPLVAGSPLRLTYNPGQDLYPVWVPGDSDILYVRERLDRGDLDRCIARMPAGGGSITAELCDRLPAADDSTDAYQWPAPDGSGRLAYVRATSLHGLGGLTPSAQELVLGRLDDQNARVLQTLPYQGPSGRGHEGIAQVRWLTPTALVYVGQRVAYQTPCQGCPTDTLPTGLELVLLDFSTATPTLRMLPGSDQASAVSVVGADTVYFTVNGDSRVLRLALSTNQLAVVHDFGGQIARDVQVVGRRCIAVVGGNVSFVNDSILGPTQRDSGGVLHLVDLVSGSDVALTDPALGFRHPALSASGDRVVAELVARRTTDLWMLTLP